MPFENLEHSLVDHHRLIRKGFPEVIYGEGKTPNQISEIASRIVNESGQLLVTRTDSEAYQAVIQRVPDAIYNPLAKTISYTNVPDIDRRSGILVACAGTTDLPVAEEAAVTAEVMGCQVVKLTDIGIAGLHRLLSHLQDLHRARVIVAVAGMEGALPNIIAGLVSCPVIAVPTSVGYGTGLDGVAALMSVLNACAPGVAVMNIDNGFGAGYMAAMINLQYSHIL
jgi:NCAIR mutase (PurE)-related protein